MEAVTDVRALMGLWLAHKRETLKSNSWETYRSAAERYIIPLLGDRRLEELGRGILQDFAGALAAAGLSPKSARDVNTKLNAAIAWAVETGILDDGPFCVRVKLPPGSGPRTLARRECERLERRLAGGGAAGAGLLLCLRAGLLPGEVCALRWTDIDLNRRTVTVRARMQRMSARDGGKTAVRLFAADGRTVTLRPDVASLLGALGHEPEGYLLTGAADRWLEPRALLYRLKRCAREAGLEETVNFNTLRATFIRTSLESGEDLRAVGRMTGLKTLGRIGARYGGRAPDAAAPGPDGWR